MDNPSSKKSNWDSILDLLGLGGGAAAEKGSSAESPLTQADSEAQAPDSEPIGEWPRTKSFEKPTRSGSRSTDSTAWNDSLEDEGEWKRDVEEDADEPSHTIEADVEEQTDVREELVSKDDPLSEIFSRDEEVVGGAADLFDTDQSSKELSPWALLAAEFDLPPPEEEPVMKRTVPKPAPRDSEKAGQPKSQEARSARDAGGRGSELGHKSREERSHVGGQSSSPVPRATGRDGKTQRGESSRNAGRKAGDHSDRRDVRASAKDDEGESTLGRRNREDDRRSRHHAKAERKTDWEFDELADIDPHDPILDDIEGFGGFSDTSALDIDEVDFDDATEPTKTEELEEGDGKKRRRRRRRGRGKGNRDAIDGDEDSSRLSAKSASPREEYIVDDDLFDEFDYPREAGHTPSSKSRNVGDSEDKPGARKKRDGERDERSRESRESRGNRDSRQRGEDRDDAYGERRGGRDNAEGRSSERDRSSKSREEGRRSASRDRDSVRQGGADRDEITSRENTSRESGGRAGSSRDASSRDASSREAARSQAASRERAKPADADDGDDAEIVVKYRGIVSWTDAISHIVDLNLKARDRGERRDNRRPRGRGGRGGGGGRGRGN